MEKVTIEEQTNRMGPHDVKRSLTKALGADHLAINYYELAPGDSFGFGYHSHENQEEVFVILEGTVTFETAEEDVAVSEGEAIRFGPGESQLGTNQGEDRVVALALGAPQDAGELHMVRECVNCGFRTPNTIELTDDRDAIVTICLECGMETGRYVD